METKVSDQKEQGGCSVRVLNPVALLQVKGAPSAKRLADLNNKKIGLYWNQKPRGDVALKRVRELLSDQFGGISFEWFETKISQGGSEEWFEHIKKSGVDGVVATSGD